MFFYELSLTQSRRRRRFGWYRLCIVCLVATAAISPSSLQILQRVRVLLDCHKAVLNNIIRSEEIHTDMRITFAIGGEMRCCEKVLRDQNGADIIIPHQLALLRLQIAWEYYQ